jgi:hypothetical protein
MKFILAFALLLGTTMALADTITFVWNPVSDDQRIAGYELHWGTAPASYDKMQVADGNAAATDSVTISITEPGTYYAAVRSRNTDGTLVSTYSNEVQFDIFANKIRVPEGFRKLIQISVN